MKLSRELPPEYSPDVLRARYPDLANFSDHAVLNHYELHGRSEGRVASTAATRHEFLALIDSSANLLEIGPYCSPVFKGDNVRYLDVFDAESLRSRALSVGIDPASCPATIHYTNGLSECAGEDFDVVFSSHAIEHQPDLISHLQQAGAALKPGGAYWMLVPDKRFCFDHYLPASSLSEVVGAYLERRDRHTAASVINHIVLQTHNDAGAHWQGDHGDVTNGVIERMRHAIAHYEGQAGGYIDTHAWQFTPQTFRDIHSGLHQLGLTPFRSARVYDTPTGALEFSVVLSK